MRSKVLSHDTPSPSQQVYSGSEKSLAAAVLRQAWHEAIIDLFVIKETTRADYSLLKKEAIDWICGGSDGFIYWCQLVDVDHIEVQQKLGEVLRSQHYPN